MAKRSEIYKTLLANGWQFNCLYEGCIALKKGDHYEAELYVDSLNFVWGVMVNEGDEMEQGFYFGYQLEDIKVENGKLILPEKGFCPHCTWFDTL